MSKKSKKSKAVGARKGRPRKSGDRFPSGRLKPVNQKNAVVVERRQALCEDITKASSPLDAALANGWIGDADHRAASVYAALYRQSVSGGPSVPTAVDVSTPTSVLDCRGIEFREMGSREVAAIWDSAMSKPGAVVGGLDDLERQQKATRASERWKAIQERMPPEVQQEMHRVCIVESWPQWINHRAIAKGKAAKIAAEDREPDAVERADIARFANSRFERGRDLLLEGCRIVRLAGRQLKVSIESVPMARRSTPAYVAESAAYVDTEGAPLYTAERRTRVRPSRI